MRCVEELHLALVPSVSLKPSTECLVLIVTLQKYHIMFILFCWLSILHACSFGPREKGHLGCCRVFIWPTAPAPEYPPCRSHAMGMFLKRCLACLNNACIINWSDRLFSSHLPGQAQRKSMLAPMAFLPPSYVTPLREFHIWINNLNK